MELVAVAHCTFDGGTPPANVSAAGVAVARTGAGIYTLTLDRGIDATNLSASVSLGSSAQAARNFRLDDTSDTVKTLTVVDGAGPPVVTDDFHIRVLFEARYGGGTAG